MLSFIRETQRKEWDKLEALHGERTGEQVLGDLCKWMDQNGALATLRHGFKCYGRTLHVAFFKAAHELNPELEARYAANRVGLTRQLHYSPRSEKSLDVTLTSNAGILPSRWRSCTVWPYSPSAFQPSWPSFFSVSMFCSKIASAWGKAASAFSTLSSRSRCNMANGARLV